MPPASGASLGASSDLYLDSEKDEGKQDPKRRRVVSSGDEDTIMEISGSELSSPAGPHINGQESTRPDQKRKRATTSPYLHSLGSKCDVSEATSPDLEEIGPDIKRRKPTSQVTTFLQKGEGRTSTPDDRGSFGLAYHGLTIPIWQKVFGFVPPVFLGRLLRVNRLFHALLESRPDFLPQGVDPSRTDPDSVWRASRKRFAPGLPRNLINQTDLGMWRLLRGNGCQLCGEKFPLTTANSHLDQWRLPPVNAASVRVIWPFGVRCCTRCLMMGIEQEKNLLLSSSFPSFLLPALPFAFISQSQHYVFSSTMKTADPPPEVQISKQFYKQHIQELAIRFNAVKDLGSGSAEEWIKGLETEGQEKASRILTWEQWEMKGGLRKVNMRPGGKGSSIHVAKAKGPPVQIPTASTGNSTTGPDTSTSLTHSSIGDPTSSVSHSGPSPSGNMGQGFQSSGALPQRPFPQAFNPRQERTLRDVNEAKAARRAEIERRCAALQPPLTPNLLRHMESFQAALHISTPLTDRAWEVLLPRLTAQRDMAEGAERDWSQHVKAIEVQTEESKRLEDAQLETKGSAERELDSTYTTLRDRLSGYADEITHTQWGGGQAVTKENCPKFAADVLIHVRKRFHEDLAVGLEESSLSLGKVDDLVSHEKTDDKLILEHMKWVFDNKIKGLTEHFQRELFMCNGCEGNSKFYGFEAVIQHYAAKHTTSLSQGSVVVHWRAEWPDSPPFNPNPSVASSAFYAVPTPNMAAASPPQPTNLHPPQPGFGNAATPLSAAPPISTPYNPGGTYAGSYYPQFSPNYPIPHQLPGATPYPSQFSQVVNHSPSVTNGPYMYPGPQNGYMAQAPYQERILNYPMVHPPNVLGQAPQHGISPQMQVGAFPGAHLYQTQKEEMAKQARDVWFATSGIKDLPQSVRIYVVIQHVVSRFEQKYTNEPGLAMFLDGLDSSPLMRPVRSLNGLACKTCVTTSNANQSIPGPLSGHGLTDRKLYTLPHLLNHFKSVHMEGSQPTIDLQTGMEASRLDWKKDMIELPEPYLITGLMTASGMNDTKLRLIASVLPRVFPDPLPNIVAIKTSGPVPKYGSHQAQNHYRSPKQLPAGEKAPASIHPGKGSVQHERSSSSSFTLHRSRESTGPVNAEPAGDDEYDPHRPAYLGRIVEHHQVSHPLHHQIRDPQDGELSVRERFGMNSNPVASPIIPRQASYPRDSGPYSSQLLRHHDKAAQQVHHTKSTSPTTIQQLESTLGRQSSTNSEVVAADNFLRELKPEMTKPGYDQTSPNSLVSPRPASQAYPGFSATGSPGSSRDMKSTYGSGKYAEAPIEQTFGSFQQVDRDEDVQYPVRRVQYVYADDGRPFEQGSEVKFVQSGYPQPLPRPGDGTYVYFDRVMRNNENARLENGQRAFGSESPDIAIRGTTRFVTHNYESSDFGAQHSRQLRQVSLRSPPSFPPKPHYHELREAGTRHVDYRPIPPEDYQYVIRYEPELEKTERFDYREGESSSQYYPGRGEPVSYGTGPPSDSRIQHDLPSVHRSYRIYR